MPVARPSRPVALEPRKARPGRSHASSVARWVADRLPGRMTTFQRRIIAGAFPDDEADLKRITCVSFARGNGKSTLMGVLAAATVIPGAPLHEANRENFIVAGSMKQGRIVKNAALDVIRQTQGIDDYRIPDSEQAISILHVPTGAKLTVIACNASTSLGIGERAKLLVGDEPAAWRGGHALYNSLKTSLGKPGADARLFMIGTRYPSSPDHWWQALIDQGDTATRRVFHLTGDARKWRQWAEVLRCNPLARQSEEFARQLQAEQEDARKSASERFSFQRIRLNSRMHGRTPDSVLLQPAQVDKLLARPPAPREGACIVSVDMAGATGWCGATAVWESGRMECFAVCPETAEAGEVQDGRDTGDYRALADAGVLVESGVTMPGVDLIEAEIRNRWPEAICIVADLYRLPQLQGIFEGELPVHLRPWRYAEQTADIATFRRLATDGPPLLTIADDGSRQIFAVSLSETVVEGESGGSVRVGKMRGERRSRNDVVSAAVMATWGIATHLAMVESDDEGGDTATEGGDRRKPARSDDDDADGIFF